MRFSRNVWAMFAALAVVATMAQVSVAQREEGRRGRGGFGGPPSGARLLALKEVQSALKLTDEQNSKIGKINDQMREDARKAMEDGGGQEKMRELMTATTAKINEVLDEGQQKRLMGIFIQVSGANAALDPAVAKELNITDDQKKQLNDARQKNVDAVRELFEAARDQEGGREAMREKLETLRDDTNKSMMAVLTSDQQAQLEALKGEKVEIDMSQLRGPGGRGREGRGGQGRADRNPESGSEKKSSN